MVTRENLRNLNEYKFRDICKMFHIDKIDFLLQFLDCQNCSLQCSPKHCEKALNTFYNKQVCLHCDGHLNGCPDEDEEITYCENFLSRRD